MTAYGAFLAAGAAAALLVAFSVADRAGLPRGRSTAFLAAGFVGALLVAKAGALAGDGGAILASGGLSGLAIPLALALGPVAARAFGLDPRRAMDAACAGAAPGLVLARIGCLVAGCCAGDGVEATWLVSLLAAFGLPPRHPAPLYEALVLAAAAPFLVRAALRSPAGTAAATFAIVWGASRLLLAATRPSHHAPWLGVAEVVLAATCVVGGARHLRRR